MSKSQRIGLLAVLYAAAFIAAFNENIINVALVDIVAAFGISTLTAQWLVTGYMIVSSIMIAAMAFLSRRFPVRMLFFTAAALFVAGLAAAAVAPCFPLLLVARLVQALGTGMFIPLMMMSVLALAPKEKMGTFLALGGCCITLGPAFGPVISGVMVTFLGWRYIFAPPIALMVLAGVAGVVCLRNYTQPALDRMDALSLVLAALGLTVVVYALTQVTTNTLAALIELVVGVVVLALFGKRQLGLDQPFLDVRPLKNPLFTWAFILNVVAMMTTFSMSVLLPLYFQNSLNMSAFQAGLLILLPIAFNAVASLAGGRIMDARGEWPLLPLGFACIVAGQFGVWALAGSLSCTAVVVATCVVYLGVGLVMSPSQTAGLKRLSPEAHGAGVSIMNVGNMVAGSLGPSLFVGVLSSRAAVALDRGLLAPIAQAAGFSAAVLVAAVIAAAGLVVAFVYALKCKE